MITELQCSYSTVSCKALMAKVIPDYCIDEPLDCLFWERGSNDTYVIRCSHGRYSLRIYRHQVYPRDEIDFEVDALNYLHNHGFPVAYPIARKSGGYITEISAPEGVRYVLVTAFAEGSPPKCDLVDDFRLTGESVARLHDVSQGFTTPHKKKDLDLRNFIDDSVSSIEPHLSHRPKERALLKQYVDNARSEIRRVGEDTMDTGFCHGDVHGGNAHLHNGVLTHYDFEECGFGFRVFDLATFKWAFNLRESKDEKWLAFVEGYQSVRKIGEADFELLDTFVLLRHIWLIAFHMRNADDFGGELTSDEYIDRQWKTLKNLTTEGIGVGLKTENEYTVVVRVIAEGPADLSGEVHVDDRIVGVGSSENADMKEVVSLPLDDVVDQIAGPKGSTVRLEILPGNKPADSPTKVVTLMRGKVKL